MSEAEKKKFTKLQLETIEQFKKYDKVRVV